jgi:hydroxypyruvate isomerase
MNLSLCLEMVFRDRPFVDRLAEAARAGFRAVEFWDWRDKDIDRIAREAERLGLTVAALSGNRKHSLLDPGARPGLLAEMDQVFEVASRLRCHNIMMLSDVLQADGSAAPSPQLPAEDRSESNDSIVQGLGALAERIAGRDITLLLEPLNTVLDHRGCFLDRSAAAVELLERVAHPGARLLYDVYHMTMMGEDAPLEIERKARWIGYLHAADRPGRHEPGSGTIDWAAIRGVLQRQSYQGFIGMEFSPASSDDAAVRRCVEVFSRPAN